MQALAWEKVGNLTPEQLVVRMRSQAVNIAVLKLADLIEATNRYPNGIYFFFDNEKLFYVGSSASRPFVERIAAHFAPGEGAYMNGVLKALAKRRGDDSPGSLLKSWKKQKLSVALLGFNAPPYSDKKAHKQFRKMLRGQEKALQRALQPPGNSSRIRGVLLKRGAKLRDLVTHVDGAVREKRWATALRAE